MTDPTSPLGLVCRHQDEGQVGCLNRATPETIRQAQAYGDDGLMRCGTPEHARDADYVARLSKHRKHPTHKETR